MKTVLISGAGIAGPTLAYWLGKYGFEPTIIEREPCFRAGGYIIDFWGIGFDVAQRMGLIPTLRNRGYHIDEIVFVSRRGKARSGFGGEALSRSLDHRFFSIQRGDLAQAIFEKLHDGTEVIFGDEVQSIVTQPDCVIARFKSGRARNFDLLVGADGLHSRLRRAMADSVGTRERYLGYCAAAFVSSGYSRRDEHRYVTFAAPGRQISRVALRDNRTGFLMTFTGNEQTSNVHTIEAQKYLLCERFSGCDWIEWPEIRTHLESCSELYFDAVTQVEIEFWSHGRIALVGDAAYAPSLLAGEASSFAMAGAYVLAGELRASAADFTRAFVAYERKFRPLLELKQKSARSFASSFLPKTHVGLCVRDLALRSARFPPVAKLLMHRFLNDELILPLF